MKRFLFVLLFFTPVAAWAQATVKQSTANAIVVGRFIDDADGKTPETAITSPTVTLKQPQQHSGAVSNLVTNGTFASATGWTANSGWAIGSGVATGTTASTDLERSDLACVENIAYEVVFDATRSAGSVVVKIGGTAGTSRSSTATFTETIICGSSGFIEFTGTGFSGTIDNVVVTQAELAITVSTTLGDANAWLHLTQGNYLLNLTAAQIPVPGSYQVSVVASGAIPVDVFFNAVNATSYAINFEGVTTTTTAIRDAILSDSTPFTGAKINNMTFTVANQLDSNVKSVAGTTQTASDLTTGIAGVQSDTDNIQTRLPAALVSSRMDSSVGAYASGQAPLQPTVAGRTLDVAATGEAGVDFSNVNGTLDAGEIGGDAITAAKVASDVATEIVGTPAGASVSADIAAAKAQLVVINADTDDIQTRLPYITRKAVSFKWPLLFLKTTDGVTPIAAAVQPVCTRALDSPTAFASTSNSPTTTTALGFSEITLSAGDMTADHYVLLRCTATGGIDYQWTFKIQTP